MCLRGNWGQCHGLPKTHTVAKEVARGVLVTCTSLPMARGLKMTPAQKNNSFLMVAVTIILATVILFYFFIASSCHSDALSI